MRVMFTVNSLLEHCTVLRKRRLGKFGNDYLLSTNRPCALYNNQRAATVVVQTCGCKFLRTRLDIFNSSVDNIYFCISSRTECLLDWKLPRRSTQRQTFTVQKRRMAVSFKTRRIHICCDWRANIVFDFQMLFHDFHSLTRETPMWTMQWRKLTQTVIS